MFVRAIVPKDNEDKVEGCYINTDKIIEVCYDKVSNIYLATINEDLRYQISKEDYAEIIKIK